ncbi:hypothetical protein TNCV_3292141 [Trichonephila clavipes]|nr:hypothetical protein TNCV_3292141 [Trichonephila clavipes]
MGQSTRIIAAFGLRKIQGSIKNFPYNLQKSLSCVDSRQHSFLRRSSLRKSVNMGISHVPLLAVSTMKFCRRLLCQNYIKDGSLHRLFFMQDGAPPHIHGSVKALLLQHFKVKRVISLFCPNPCLPRSLSLTP